MQFLITIIFATIIWFAVRYVVLEVGHPNRPKNRKRKNKPYPNVRKLIEYFHDDSTVKTPVPWKGFVKQFGNSELKNDVNFDGFNAKQMKLFENIFEIIKTEHTYLEQLKQLIQASTDPTLGTLISIYDRRRLFGKIARIHQLNEELFTKICDQFDNDFLMPGIFESLQQFLSDKSVRDCYVEYNRFHEERNMLVISLSKKPETSLFPLQSLTIAPVQRVTRYSLLLQSILSNCPSKDDSKQNDVCEFFDYDSIEKTLKAAIDFAECCNKALDSELKLMSLARLKNQIDGNIVAVKEFVNRGREIILDTSVKLHRVKIDDSLGSALHNFSASVIHVKKVRLVLLTDLLLLLIENKNKKSWRIYDQDLLTSIDITFPKNEPLSPKNLFNFEKSPDGDKPYFSPMFDEQLTKPYEKSKTKFYTSNPQSSSESDEKQSTDSTGSLAGCDARMKITFGKSGRHFALLFGNEDEEDTFVMAFNKLRSQQYNL